LKGSDDCFDYAFHIVKNVRIPETQNRKTLLFQPRIACDIHVIFGMLAAICLDNNPMFEANEVNNIAVVNDLLPTPAKPIKPLIPQNVPKLPFGIGGVGAHKPRTLFEQFVPRLHLR